MPPPTLGGAPNAQSPFLPPFPSDFLPLLALIEPSLEPADLEFLTTGATGAAVTRGAPDMRVTNYAALPNGPFQLTGPHLPYDSYTGDTVHRSYQTWQQSDCSIQNATEDNPAGCVSDLYPFVATTYAGPTADQGGGTSMAFYNMQDGDAPLFKKLADEYTISDNYHQPMGGTGIQHVFLGAGDDIFWSAGDGNPALLARFANRQSQSASGHQQSLHILDGVYSDCSNIAAPGLLPIRSYLASLPYGAAANCDPGHYYMLNNTNPVSRRTARPTSSGSWLERRSRPAMSRQSATR